MNYNSTDFNNEKAFEAISDRFFFVDTLVASSHAMTRDILKAKTEVQKLLLSPQENLGRVLKTTYLYKENPVDQGKLIICFILIAEAKQKANIDTILNYLRGFPEDVGDNAYLPTHPFLHAIWALDQITQGKIGVGADIVTITEIPNIIRNTEVWLGRV